MSGTKLTPVIKVDDEKCVNCYACVAACPVKYCMDGTGDAPKINHDLCIGCGNCITSCKRGARSFFDNGDAFFRDLGRGEKIVAIVAPAAASNFEGRYLNLNGYLKSLGVQAVFDVSFGAELTVLSYVNYMKEKKPSLVISQPCPAIVTYIELFVPSLLPMLAPADSPMLHTIRMIKEYYPQYRNHKVAVISPCIAKRREFDETGLGDYNVTFITIKGQLEKEKKDLASCKAMEYDNPEAERAVTFPMPGGLLRTADREVPGIWEQTRKIEGPEAIYPYLDHLADSLKKGGHQSVSFVDCLNCEKGCNGGPGTGFWEEPQNELEYPIQQRAVEAEKKYTLKSQKKSRKELAKVLNKYWKPGLYGRNYVDLSGNYTIREPSPAELTEVYKKIGKYSEDDIYDCNACGYGSCKRMAKAIFNKLNVPKNCLHYNLFLLNKQDKLAELNVEMKKQIGKSLSVIDSINSLVDVVSSKMAKQSESVDHSSAAVGEMVSSIHKTSEVSQKKRDDLQGLVDVAARGQGSMRETIQAVEDIAKSVDGVSSTIKLISGIASNTNLLSMNAAIEAAHAGDAGRGFSVVAGEIRRLSEDTRANSQNISVTLSNIIKGIKVTSTRSGETENHIAQMSSEIHSFAETMAELISTFGELSSGSTEITSALENLKALSSEVKISYNEMLNMTLTLRQALEELSAVAERSTAD
ncbi:[Fe-Fe] hydrogenase large subunit C-terminal domain-containing protein [Leadbettera azotonutricia]|nr:[Fe-Fe] hydrogenase large subunit C-terminal domain-containing protein [Leadbettera azotonutricia]AEF83173.1 4Fe-4S binding domain protein [Leadbettera azotonutricia ZAS-9]